MPTNLTPWKTIGTKCIYKTPWIELVQDACEVDGQSTSYTYVRRVDSGPMIIAVADDGKLWMVRQYRHPIKKIIWQFPAEGTMPGESWEQTAARGLQEELHLSAQKLVDLGEFHPDPGGLDQAYHLFVATELSAPDQSSAGQEKYHTDADNPEHEELERHLFSRAEIDIMITTGEICDNWTLAGLYLLDRYLRQ